MTKAGKLWPAASVAGKLTATGKTLQAVIERRCIKCGKARYSSFSAIHRVVGTSNAYGNWTMKLMASKKIDGADVRREISCH
jgi:hypothetical protein